MEPTDDLGTLDACLGCGYPWDRWDEGPSLTVEALDFHKQSCMSGERYRRHLAEEKAMGY